MNRDADLLVTPCQVSLKNPWISAHPGPGDYTGVSTVRHWLVREGSLGLITRATYCYVENGQPVPTCELEDVRNVEVYLEEHIESLMKLASEGTGPPARFRTSNDSSRFEALLHADDSAFLASSQSLVERLLTHMDGRSRRGFFVALVTEIGAGRTASVLKLDVHDKSGAAMRRTRGRPRLESVQDLLDVPGELQKGAVYPDPRTVSEIIVGDKLAETSYYFLECIGVVQTTKAGLATASFVKSIAGIVSPGATIAVVRALEGSGPVNPIEFLRQRPELLDGEQLEAVEQQLRIRKRPIEVIDPSSRVIDEVVSADGITIRGRAADLADKLRVLPRGAGWRIQIDVDEEPRRTWP